MNLLSKEEHEELKAKHKLERDRRICDRIKSILLSNDGWSDQEIAKVLLLSKSGIRAQITEYKNSQKLKPSGGGSTEKLTLKQSKELEKHLASLEDSEAKAEYFKLVNSDEKSSN